MSDTLFRVFLTRHYIATEWYDIQATSESEARRKAAGMAQKLRPDPRAEANDTGWVPEEPTLKIGRLGQHGIGRAYGMRETEIGSGVFHIAEI